MCSLYATACTAQSGAMSGPAGVQHAQSRDCYRQADADCNWSGTRQIYSLYEYTIQLTVLVMLSFHDDRRLSAYTASLCAIRNRPQPSRKHGVSAFSAMNAVAVGAIALFSLPLLWHRSIDGCLRLFFFTAVRPEVWEPVVSYATTEGSSYGQTRTTRRVTWVTSGRSPLQELPTPRELCWRKCETGCSQQTASPMIG